MKDKRNCHDAVGKLSLKQHFCKSELCEISGALHLALPGHMASWQADKIQVNFEIFKVVKIFDLLLRLTKVQHHYNLTNALQLVFSGKAYCKVDFLKCKIFQKPFNFPPIPTIKYYRT